MPPNFRPATIRDARLLYDWRHQAEHTPWQNRDHHTSWAEHVDWLQARITNPLVELLIWEEDGEPAGTIRIDSNGELSFHADDTDTAIRMLQTATQLAGKYGGRIKVTLDAHDPRSLELKAAGFHQYPAKSLIHR